MNKFVPVVLVILFFLTSPLFSLGFDFGVYGGKDFYKISEMQKNFQLADLTAASVEREGVQNPWMFGANFRLNFIGGISLETTAEAAYAKYKVIYSIPSNPSTDEYDITWTRIAVLATLEKNLFSAPTTELYGGIGGGLHMVTPVVSDKFLINTLKDKSAELDVSEDINLESKFGGHALVGFQFHPPLTPIKFKLEGKYIILPKGDYEEPNSFFTVYLGIMYSLGLGL